MHSTGVKNKSAAAVCLACVVGGVSLLFIATRPCEPVAQASVEAPVLQVPEVTIVGDPVVRTVSVEDLPRVVAIKGHRMAPPAKKPCDPFTSPTAIWHEQDLQAGTIGSTVLVGDCQ